MKHTAKKSDTIAVAGVKVASKNSLFSRMLETKKAVRAYVKGDISLSDLEAKGIELA